MIAWFFILLGLSLWWRAGFMGVRNMREVVQLDWEKGKGSEIWDGGAEVFGFIFMIIFGGIFWVVSKAIQSGCKSYPSKTKEEKEKKNSFFRTRQEKIVDKNKEEEG